MHFFFVPNTCALATRSKLPESVAQSHKRSDASHASDLPPFISSQGLKKKSVFKFGKISLSYKSGRGGCGWATGKVRRYVSVWLSPGDPWGPGPQAMSFRWCGAVMCCSVGGLAGMSHIRDTEMTIIRPLIWITVSVPPPTHHTHATIHTNSTVHCAPCAWQS